MHQKNQNDDNYDLTKNELQTGIQKCREHVRNLCHNALLLENGSIALGLYLFALEEYGKMIWLEEILKKNKVKFLVPKIIFGKGEKRSCAHKQKMEKALAKLPPLCKKLSINYLIARNLTMKTKTFTINREKKVSLAMGGTVDLVEPVNANVNLRLNCFLIDWDDNQKGWKLSITQTNSLERALKKLNKIVLSTDK